MHATPNIKRWSLFPFSFNLGWPFDLALPIECGRNDILGFPNQTSRSLAASTWVSWNFHSWDMGKPATWRGHMYFLWSLDPGECQVNNQHQLPVIWEDPLGCLAHLMTPAPCAILLYYAYEKPKQEPLSWTQLTSKNNKIKLQFILSHRI